MAGNRACVPFLIAWLVRPPDFFSGQFQKLVSERVNLIPRKIAVLDRRTYYIVTVGRSAIIALNIASESSIVDNLDGSTRRIGRSRSEEHTSELQSLMRLSYAVFCLKKKKTNKNQHEYI